MAQAQLYVELECQSCKQTFMLADKIHKMSEINKHCPSCSSSKIIVTGNQGTFVTLDSLRQVLVNSPQYWGRVI